MEKRVCPECKKPCYSANRNAEYWRCPYCDTKISVEFQKDITGRDESEE